MASTSEDREVRRTTRGTGAPGKSLQDTVPSSDIITDKEPATTTAPSAPVEQVTVKRSDSAQASEEDQLASADGEGDEMEVDSAEVEENGNHGASDDAREEDELQSEKESGDGEVGERLVKLPFGGGPRKCASRVYA